jgi:hypothetical protein
VDPDKLLREISAISRNTPNVPHVGDALREMAHKFNQLDDWLTGGRELPAQWRKRDVPGHDPD